MSVTDNINGTKKLGEEQKKKLKKLLQKKNLKQLAPNIFLIKNQHKVLKISKHICLNLCGLDFSSSSTQEEEEEEDDEEIEYIQENKQNEILQDYQNKQKEDQNQNVNQQTSNSEYAKETEINQKQYFYNNLSSNFLTKTSSCSGKIQKIHGNYQQIRQQIYTNKVIMDNSNQQQQNKNISFANTEKGSLLNQPQNYLQKQYNTQNSKNQNNIERTKSLTNYDKLKQNEYQENLQKREKIQKLYSIKKDTLNFQIQNISQIYAEQNELDHLLRKQISNPNYIKNDTNYGQIKQKQNQQLIKSQNELSEQSSDEEDENSEHIHGEKCLLLEKEFQIMKQLNTQHKSLIKYYKFYKNIEVNGQICCALEMNFYEGGDYFQNFIEKKQDTIEYVKHMKSGMKSLLEVLNLMHQQGVAHNDIKPENILVTEDPQMPILIDLEYAEFSQSENLYERQKDTWDMRDLRYSSPDIFIFQKQLKQLEEDQGQQEIQQLNQDYVSQKQKHQQKNKISLINEFSNDIYSFTATFFAIFFQSLPRLSNAIIEKYSYQDQKEIIFDKILEKQNSNPQKDKSSFDFYKSFYHQDPLALYHFLININNEIFDNIILCENDCENKFQNQKRLHRLLQLIILIDFFLQGMNPYSEKRSNAEQLIRHPFITQIICFVNDEGETQIFEINNLNQHDYSVIFTNLEKIESLKTNQKPLIQEIINQYIMEENLNSYTQKNQNNFSYNQGQNIPFKNINNVDDIENKCVLKEHSKYKNMSCKDIIDNKNSQKQFLSHQLIQYIYAKKECQDEKENADIIQNQNQDNKTEQKSDNSNSSSQQQNSFLNKKFKNQQQKKANKSNYFSKLGLKKNTIHNNTNVNTN